MTRYLAFAEHLRRRFGERVQKVPLDAGSDCPNRDGFLSTKGCAFCNPRGSGSGLADQGLPLSEQWTRWTAHYRERKRARLFLAYLQSFSNTHGPIERLRGLLDELRGLPDIVGLAVGTRPDCLDPAKLDLLAAQPFTENWLELGLQSSNNATLERINRGHDAACFAHAAREAAERGLMVCAHVIAGLPGETLADFLATVEFVNALPVAGIKFHNLYVARGTALAVEYKRGRLDLLSLDETVAWLVEGLTRLRPDIVVQRLTGDPAPGELLAPAWGADKGRLRRAIDTELERRDLRQGCQAEENASGGWGE